MRRLSLCLLLAACSDPTISVGTMQEVLSFPATPNRDLDILFVVDDSASMTPKQAALTASFPRMMDRLAELEGGLPNLHIGVVTSDMGTSSSSGDPAPGIAGCFDRGDDGALQHANAPTLTGAFISDVDDGAGGRARNYTGELRDVFQQIATVGDTGCGLEQPLAAMRQAFNNPANEGFLRPDANLAVVVIADEDDCSALMPSLFSSDTSLYGPLNSYRCTRFGLECDPDNLDEPGDKTNCVPDAGSQMIEDVQIFVDTLLAVKGDPRKVLVAAIVGDPSQVTVTSESVPGSPPALTLAEACELPGGDFGATPAVRLAAFLDAFPGRSTFTSLCSGDLTTPLATIGNSAKQLVGDPCLDTSTLLDSSDRLPGVQPACEVVDIDGTAREVVIPNCASGATDCFEIVPDAAACPSTPDNLRVRLRRSAIAPTDIWTHVRCQVQR